MSKSHIELKIEGLELACKAIRDQIRKLKVSILPKTREVEKDKEYLKLLRGIPSSLKANKVCHQIETGLPIEQLGRAGEIAFQNYLHEILDSSQCEIRWLNQGYESKKPYDFIVKIQTETFYIDVKTTRSDTKHKFFMSDQEIKFARNNKQNYFVARLSQYDNLRRYKADSFNVKMLNLDQALKLINNK